MDDLSVEVRRTAGIYLKAKIVDVLQDFVVVELENNLHVRKEFPFNEVRFPPKLLPGKIEYAEGEQIEVSLVLESEESTECWVSGRVHLVKGEFVVAIFDVNGVKPQDIFPSDRVRRPNKNASITSESFHKHIIPIPSDLTSICQDVSNHKEFMQTCGASSVQYNPKLSAIVVLSCNEAVIKKAVLLTDMHLKSLRQKCALVQMMKDASKKLEQSTRHHHHPTAPYHDDFTVSKELMGLAIGSHGSNIQQAKQVPGIKGIELDENTGTFTIYGDSQKAVAAARSLLEFKKETINLPKNFISRVIGRNGHHIQDIVDRSGVLRVKIKNDEFPEEPQSSSINESSVPFIFVGTADSINNAKLLLNYQVNHLKEVEQLTIQKRQLDAQLRDLSISNTREQFPPRESESEREDTRGGKSRGQRGRPGYRGNRGQGRWLGNRQSLQNNEYQEGLGTRIATSDMDNRYGDQAQRGHYPDDRYQGDDMRGRGSARGRHVRPYAGGKHSLSPQQRPAYSDDVRKGGGGEGRDIPCKAEIERIAEQMANGQ